MSDTALYNASTKENFLNDMIEKKFITEDTSKNYERIFNITSPIEDSLNKDLSHFTFDELEKIMYGFEANNRNTVETYSRIISSYLNWCVENNIIRTNPLEILKPNDFIKYLTNEEIYYTDKQIRRWESRMDNYQDAVIVRLLFIGVGGKQFSEIRNLKKTDIKGNMIKLTNTLKEDENGNIIKYTERWFEVDDYTLNLIEGALEQKTYSKRNGFMNVNPHVRPYTDLIDNDFIIRSSVTNTENLNTPVDKHVIYRRLQMLSEVLNIDSFTAKHIQRSGMIFYAKEIMRNNKISLDDLKIIANRFGVKSYHNLKGIITVENIKKTYTVD